MPSSTQPSPVGRGSLMWRGVRAELLARGGGVDAPADDAGFDVSEFVADALAEVSLQELRRELQEVVGSTRHALVDAVRSQFGVFVRLAEALESSDARISSLEQPLIDLRSRSLAARELVLRHEESLARSSRERLQAAQRVDALHVLIRCSHDMDALRSDWNQQSAHMPMDDPTTTAALPVADAENVDVDADDTEEEEEEDDEDRDERWSQGPLDIVWRGHVPTQDSKPLALVRSAVRGLRRIRSRATDSAAPPSSAAAAPPHAASLHKANARAWLAADALWAGARTVRRVAVAVTTAASQASLEPEASLTHHSDPLAPILTTLRRDLVNVATTINTQALALWESLSDAQLLGAGSRSAGAAAPADIPSGPAAATRATTTAAAGSEPVLASIDPAPGEAASPWDYSSSRVDPIVATSASVISAMSVAAWLRSALVSAEPLVMTATPTLAAGITALQRSLVETHPAFASLIASLSTAATPGSLSSAADPVNTVRVYCAQMQAHPLFFALQVAAAAGEMLGAEERLLAALQAAAAAPPPSAATSSTRVGQLAADAAVAVAWSAAMDPIVRVARAGRAPWRPELPAPFSTALRAVLALRGGCEHAVARAVAVSTRSISALRDARGPSRQAILASGEWGMLTSVVHAALPTVYRATALAVSAPLSRALAESPLTPAAVTFPSAPAAIRLPGLDPACTPRIALVASALGLASAPWLLASPSHRVHLQSLAFTGLTPTAPALGFVPDLAPQYAGLSMQILARGAAYARAVATALAEAAGSKVSASEDVPELALCRTAAASIASKADVAHMAALWAEDCLRAAAWIRTHAPRGFAGMWVDEVGPVCSDTALEAATRACAPIGGMWAEASSALTNAGIAAASTVGADLAVTALTRMTHEAGLGRTVDRASAQARALSAASPWVSSSLSEATRCAGHTVPSSTATAVAGAAVSAAVAAMAERAPAIIESARAAAASIAWLAASASSDASRTTEDLAPLGGGDGIALQLLLDLACLEAALARLASSVAPTAEDTAGLLRQVKDAITLASDRIIAASPEAAAVMRHA